MIGDLQSLQREVDEIAEYIDKGEYVNHRYSEDPYRYSATKDIRGSFFGFHEVEPPFLTILDSPFMQRLRFIHQTTFAHFTYLSSHHNRLEHSLGVYSATKLILDAIEKNMGIEIEEPFRTEAELAALIHDIGHGPFSHASEEIYRHAPVFPVEKDRFGDAVPSEILAFCLIKSPPFQTLLEEFQSQTDAGSISDDRVANMILGYDEGLPENYQFLRYVINGPFDADKFDYINRDGLFTDLNVSLDNQRLMRGFRVNEDRTRVVIDSGSLPALEQVFIGKAQLYSQVYHHQKVRAAASVIRRIFTHLQNADAEPIDGFNFQNPATYLALEDPDILGRKWSSNRVNEAIENFRRRRLPKRALVLTFPCFPDKR